MYGRRPKVYKRSCAIHGFAYWPPEGLVVSSTPIFRGHLRQCNQATARSLQRSIRARFAGCRVTAGVSHLSEPIQNGFNTELTDIGLRQSAKINSSAPTATSFKPARPNQFSPEHSASATWHETGHLTKRKRFSTLSGYFFKSAHLPELNPHRPKPNNHPERQPRERKPTNERHASFVPSWSFAFPATPAVSQHPHNPVILSAELSEILAGKTVWFLFPAVERVRRIYGKPIPEKHKNQQANNRAGQAPKNGTDLLVLLPKNPVHQIGDVSDVTAQ